MLQLILTKAQCFESRKTPNWNKTPVSPSLSIKKGATFVVISAKVPRATLEQTEAVEKADASMILGKL